MYLTEGFFFPDRKTVRNVMMKDKNNTIHNTNIETIFLHTPKILRNYDRRCRKGTNDSCPELVL